MNDMRFQLIFEALDRTKGAVQSMRGGLDSVTQQVFSLRGALAGLGIGLVVRDIMQAGMAAQGMANALKATTGSAENAAREWTFVNAEVDRLGINLQSAAGDFTQLAASAKGTSLAGQGVRDIFTAVAEAATVLNLSAEQTHGTLYSVGQMMSKGTVMAEELRGQMGERLYGAFQDAAKAMGVSTVEMGKMLERGEVMATDFLPRFAATLREKFAGGVAEASKSARADLNRFHTELFRLKTDFAQSGFMDAVIAALNAVSTTLKDPGLTESARQLGKEFKYMAEEGHGLSGALQSVVVVIEKLVVGMMTLRTMAKAGGTVLGGLAAAAQPQPEKKGWLDLVTPFSSPFAGPSIWAKRAMEQMFGSEGEGSPADTVASAVADAQKELEAGAAEIDAFLARLNQQRPPASILPPGIDGQGSAADGDTISAKAKKLAEAWADTKRSLTLDVSQLGLDEFEQKILAINDKAAELGAKFPEQKAAIEEWRAAMVQNEEILAAEADLEARLNQSKKAIEDKTRAAREAAEAQQRWSESLNEVTLAALPEQEQAVESIVRQYDRLREQVLALITANEEFKARGIELWNELDQRQQDALKKLSEQGKKTFGEDFKSAFEGWASNFSAQLNEMVWSADRSFGKILESFAKMVTQMVLQKMIVEPFVNFGLDMFGFGNSTPGGNGVDLKPVKMTVNELRAGGDQPPEINIHNSGEPMTVNQQASTTRYDQGLRRWVMDIVVEKMAQGANGQDRALGRMMGRR
jgi:tape measure domain-containing protein